MSSSLAEIRVIETAQHVAGPYCGKLLADHGADVIKVEPPGGDRSRARGPFPDDRPDADRSGLFLHLNTNKKSVVLDLETDAGGRLLGGLVAGARLLIDDGTLAAAGVDVAALLAAYPALVVVQVSGYGDGGPYGDYRANDYAIYASSAWMCAMGDPDRPPLYPGRDYPFYVCGLYAAFGALVALRHARQTGQGQRVSVSALDASISFDFYETTKFSYRGKLRRRDSHMITGVAASTQPCQDGYVALTFAGEDDWQRFCEVIEAPELAQGEFETATLRLANTDELNRRVQEALSDKTQEHVVRECQARHVAVSPVATTADLLRSEQLHARDWFAQAGGLTLTGAPFHLQHPQWRIDAPAPALGADQALVEEPA
jgi:crotonobetainyl-CoA:carnitine CoA-transferase CaiB-like acyl-CoA transferase